MTNQRRATRTATGLNAPSPRQQKARRFPLAGFSFDVVAPNTGRRPCQTARRFSALVLPRIESTLDSNESFWPSLSELRPARSTALMCTNTSLPPSSGAMKPNPLVALNHLTVPVVIYLLQNAQKRDA